MTPRTLFELCVVLVFALACSASEGGGGQGGQGGQGGAGAATTGGTGASTASGGAGSGGSGASTTGGGQIGDACVSNDDCKVPADAECWTTIGGGFAPEITFPGGFCSKACDTNGESDQCGQEAGCSSTAVSGGQGSVTLTMCSPPCSSNAECRESEGYKCLQLIPGFGVCTL